MKRNAAMWRRVLTLTVSLFFVGMLVAEDPAKLPKPTSYVCDFAGVVDTSSTASLEAYGKQLHDKTHTTLAVVTVKTLDDLSIEEFTTQLEDNWKVGKQGEDKGLLIVLSMQPHKWRIEPGYGLEGVLNDAKVGDIGRSVVPQLKEGQYGAALLSASQQAGAAIAKDANVTLDDSPAVHTYRRQAVRRHNSFGGVLAFLFILFFFIVISRGGRGGRGGGGGSGVGWFLLGSLLNSGGNRGWGDSGGGGGGGWGGSDGGGYGGDSGGSSGGGGASGDW